jgi:hypothetical protein
MIKIFNLKYLFTLIFLANSVAALETEISFESIYDHASEKLTVDGVSTSYSLGSAGIRVDWKTDQNLLFHASFGMGYFPNYKMSAFGTNFSGPVEGSMKNIGGQYRLYKAEDHKLSVSFEIHERYVNGNNFRGVRNGQSLKVKSTAAFELSDFSLGYEYFLSRSLSLGFNAGITSWKFDASGLTLLNNMAISKKVTESGQSPKVQFYANVGSKKPVEVFLTRRAYSVDNFVETYELMVRFPLYSFK